MHNCEISQIFAQGNWQAFQNPGKPQWASNSILGAQIVNDMGFFHACQADMQSAKAVAEAIVVDP